MGKKDSKHGHRKKLSHKKKHKKEKKKYKKDKKPRAKENTENSESDSSTDSSSSYELQWEEKKLEDTNVKREERHFHDESEWDNLFSDKTTFRKEKNMDKKEQYVLDRPGQSDRELNPYWKDGGSGFPPPKEISNQDINSLQRLLPSAKATSSETGEPVEATVRREYGSYEKLRELIRASDNFYDSTHPPERNNAIEENAERRLNFKKPGETTNLGFTNTYKRNWRKKEMSSVDTSDRIHGSDRIHQRKEGEQKHLPTKETSKTILTLDELNALTAKALKAEIMGNKSLAEQLKKEIEVAKKNREEFLAAGGSKMENKPKQTVILTKTNVKGVTKPLHKTETSKGSERARAIIDDKYSLKTMFEKEKFGSTEESEEMFFRMAKRAKFHSENEADGDDFMDRARCSDFEKEAAEKERNRNICEARQKHKSLNNCRWCLDGENAQKHTLISVGNKCYLCLPSDESLTNGHCLIVPIHHVTCGTLLDEDVWEEMQIYRKRLCQMCEDAGQDIIFFENARSLHRFPHMVLHCVPMDREAGDLAPMYFKKAILDSETEWSNNKKLIDLKNKNLRRSIPKGLPYFAVDFGREGGFAHVIEDEKLFPFNFAEEVIGGMLDLNVQKWRKRRKESYSVQQEKVSEFSKKWKRYEFSNQKKRSEFSVDFSDSDQ